MSHSSLFTDLVASKTVAKMLGVTRPRVSQLVKERRLTTVLTPFGRPLFRRAEVLALARSRAARLQKALDAIQAGQATSA